MAESVITTASFIMAGVAEMLIALLIGAGRGVWRGIGHFPWEAGGERVLRLI
ncbi:hypothetical protein [Aestuariivirga litoralis]|uniref:hypothetical protein n=1 Tax=Aestuariivirga litoralis TaxID=2650924 RepID=UPI00137AD074|nr:hypothetical protein [Aestuariivirga litoralis]